MHDVALLGMDSRCVVGRGDNGAASRVEAEVSLVHKLLVEAGVDRGVVVLNGRVVVVGLVGVDLCTVLEKFVQNALLLVVVNVHTFSLDGTAARSKTENEVS